METEAQKPQNDKNCENCCVTPTSSGRLARATFGNGEAAHGGDLRRLLPKSTAPYCPGGASIIIRAAVSVGITKAGEMNTRLGLAELALDWLGCRFVLPIDRAQPF
jgi:hypothetical protein